MMIMKKLILTFRHKVINRLKKILEINVLKTIWINLKISPHQILKCPIIIYKHVIFRNLSKGNIILEKPICHGRVHIGRHDLPQLDKKFTRTIIDIKGDLIFKGDAIIGAGSKIIIYNNAQLILGKHFIITGNTDVICSNSITFGDYCLVSWENLIMDTDFHYIYEQDSDIQINRPAPITIGNNVWISCRNTILKGCNIPNNSIIASNSTISQYLDNENCIYGNHGRIIKNKIYWKG